MLLQPGDFYLQVAPFCDQSARIVVCSLLEDEDLLEEVVEETPIPETSYPCIFSLDWLDELNNGRQGTPLSRCLLATEQGVVSLPWERVAVPEFADRPHSARSSMASAPRSYPPLPSPHPLLSPLPNSSSNQSLPLIPSKESALKPLPLTIQNSVLTSSSHPSAFSVETRICPAKHGIAVSLCLVDVSAASSSRLIRVTETESEPKPLGWVSTNMWDSRFTGKGTSTRPSTVSDTWTPTNTDLIVCKGQDKSAEITAQDKGKDRNLQDTSRGEPAPIVGAEGEYIDILQATVLFGRAQSIKEEKQKSEAQIQPHAQIQGQMQRYPQRPAQIQPQDSHRQTQGQTATRMPPPTQWQAPVQLPAKPQTQSHHRPNESAEKGPSSTFSHSQPHHPHSDFTDPSECIRTVHFSEKPCTPCMRRKQGGKVSRAQELRCRYRESYQAALQNPVTFGKEKEKGAALAVVEEDGDFSLCNNRQGPLETETRDLRFNVQRMYGDSGMQNHRPEAVCKELGEYDTAPYWKPGDTNITPCMDYRGINACHFGELPEQTYDRTTVPFREPLDVISAYGSTHNVNGTNSIVETQMTNAKAQSSSNGTGQSRVSTKHHGLLFSSNEISGKHVTLKPCEQLPNRTSSAGSTFTASQNRQVCTSDKRCSSLSTAVVDTSEKCELVIVDGKNVRRKENTNSCAEIPQLHVVKCKNSTAFRLVSPKINRRKMAVLGTHLSHSSL